MRPNKEQPGWSQLEDALKWCFRLFKGAFILCVISFFLSGIHTIPQGKMGGVQRLGTWLPELEEPGLHFGFPSLVDRIIIFEPQKRKELKILDFSPAIQQRGGSSDQVLITGDGQLLHSQWSIVYRVSEPLQMLKAFGIPESHEMLHQRIEATLRQLFLGAVISQTGTRSIDELLSEQRLYRSSVLESLNQKISQAQNGLSIEELSLDQVGVPASTQEAFQGVQRQMLMKDQKRQEALNDSRQQLQQLEAQKSASLGQAKAQAERIKSTLRAEAKNIQFLVEKSDDKLRQAWLDIKLENVLHKGLLSNSEQTFWIEPGGELRLNLNKDPQVEQLRREKARQIQEALR
jgi:regulator of protease activity HflC (stomatin/prohibitin superfamily)